MVEIVTLPLDSCELTVTVTGLDVAFVCVFLTRNCAVAGLARLLLLTVAASVFASTAEVLSAVPFQRMTAEFEKFDPTTVIVIVLEPAAII